MTCVDTVWQHCLAGTLCLPGTLSLAGPLTHAGSDSQRQVGDGSHEEAGHQGRGCCRTDEAATDFLLQEQSRYAARGTRVGVCINSQCCE